MGFTNRRYARMCVLCQKNVPRDKRFPRAMRFFAAAGALVCMLSLAACSASPSDDTESGSSELSQEESALTTIYIVGDSTAASFDDHADNASFYLPRYGFGTQLYRSVDSTQAQVVNLAVSGKSLTGFTSHANYTAMKQALSSGDYAQCIRELAKLQRFLPRIYGRKSRHLPRSSFWSKLTAL